MNGEYASLNLPIRCLALLKFFSCPESVGIFLRRTCLLREEQRFAILITEEWIVKVFFFFFFGSPTWCVAERDKAALIGIGLAKKLWACCCYCGGGSVKGSFWKMGEVGKFSDSFLDNTSLDEDVPEIACGRSLMV